MTTQQKALCIDIDLISGVALGLEFEWDETGSALVLSIGILRLYIGWIDLEKVNED
jgi:hypothetical protein